jgi:N-glycosylase/DNA lyase
MSMKPPLAFDREILNAGQLTLQAEVEAKLRDIRRIGQIVSQLGKDPEAGRRDVANLLTQIARMLDANTTIRELLLELQDTARSLSQRLADRP